MTYGNLQRIWNLSDGFSLISGMYLSQTIGNYLRFQRRAAASVRKPTCSVILEGHGDISAYVKNYSFERRLTDSLHEPNPANGNMVLIDKDGEFSENGHTTIKVNDKIKIFAGFNDDNIPRFKGIVTDPKLNSDTKEISVAFSDYGYILRRSHTSGDYTAYNSPKLLVERLMSMANLGVPVFENDTGSPVTFDFGLNATDKAAGHKLNLNERTYWAMTHGANFCIFYIPYFDEEGVMQCKRRSGFTDADILFDDSNIISLAHRDMAEMINSKTVDFSPNTIRWEFTLGDALNVGQYSRVKTNSDLKARYGEYADAETDELVGTWTHAGEIIDEALAYYPYPRHLFDLRTPALPQLQLMDRIRVRSEKRNILGRFIVWGVSEVYTPGNFYNTFTLLSAAERN